MKKIIFIGCALLFLTRAEAQDYVDNALLFSRTMPAGSARVLAVGGAQTALGGDFSSALSNPAGLGMYNRSEFTITPGLTFSTSDSFYRGASTSDSRSSFNIPGLSFVFHHESGKDHGFLGGSFAITMSRQNDFNRNFTYRGTNSDHSIIDYFIDDAYGLDPNSMLWVNQDPGENFFTLTGLAYNNYLIEEIDGEPGYASVLSPLPAEPGFPAEVRTLDQQEVSESRGAQSQWSFSYGANFDDKFFLGAGVGISSIRWKLRQTFTESNFRYTIDGAPSGYDPIDNFSTEETYDIRGSGINLTLGAIYRPVNFFQVGVSYMSPTVYGITDTYDARVESNWNIQNLPDNPSYPDQANVYEEFGEPLLYEYNLRTPMRLNTGAAFLSQYGFISADVEFVNYAKAKYSTDFQEGFSGENNAIKAAYQPVINYRLGGEFRHEQYRVRAGYSYMPNPYQNEDDTADQSIRTISGGLGYRTSTYFIDLAAMFSKTDRQRSPYFVNGEDPIALQTFKTAIYRLTLGFIF